MARLGAVIVRCMRLAFRILRLLSDCGERENDRFVRAEREGDGVRVAVAFSCFGGYGEGICRVSLVVGAEDAAVFSADRRAAGIARIFHGGEITHREERGIVIPGIAAKEADGRAHRVAAVDPLEGGGIARILVETGVRPIEL